MRRRTRLPEERTFVRYLMTDGARSRAERLLDAALGKASRTIRGVAPEDILLKALGRARPLIEVRKRRVGRGACRVPVPVPAQRGTVLAIRGLIDAARRARGASMTDRLARAIVGAYRGTLRLPGPEDVHPTDDPKRRKGRRLSARAAYGAPG